jgi:hypothetical protein
MPDLKVGDSVLWRGAWGTEPERVAKVTKIQINEANGSKYGEHVQAVGWDTVVERRVIVSIDIPSGEDDGGPLTRWAWANQIRPDDD